MFEAALQWLSEYDYLLWWLAAGSALLCVASLILVPVLVLRLPADYFSCARDTRKRVNSGHHLLVRLGKNALGLLCIVLGIIMLVTPGQGLLTLLVGIMLTDLPGKQRLEQYLLQRPAVFAALNWLRKRGGKPPFESAQSTTDDNGETKHA